MAKCNFQAPNGQVSQLHAGLFQLLGEPMATIAWYKLQSLSTNDEEPSVDEGLSQLGIGTHEQVNAHKQLAKEWKLSPAPGKLMTYYGTEKLARAMHDSGVSVNYDPVHGMITFGTQQPIFNFNEKDAVIEIPDFTKPKDKDHPVTQVQLEDHISKLTAQAIAVPETNFKLPYTAEAPTRKMYNGFTAIDIAQVFASQKNIPANIIFDPSFSGLISNLPMKFLGNEIVFQDQTIREAVKIDDQKLRDAQAKLFIEIKDAAGKGTGKFFTADQQIEAGDSLLYEMQLRIRKGGDAEQMSVGAISKNIKAQYQRVLSGIYLPLSQGTRITNTDGTDRFPTITKEQAESYRANMENVLNNFDEIFKLTTQRLSMYSIDISDQSSTSNKSFSEQIDENAGKGLVDFNDEVFALDPKDTASGRMKLFVATLEDVERGTIPRPKNIKLPLKEDVRTTINAGIKTTTFRTQEQAQKDVKLTPGVIGQDTGVVDINGTEYLATATKVMNASDAEAYNNDQFEKEEQLAKAGDILIELKPYTPGMTGFNIKRSFIGTPRLANLESVLEKAFGTLAGLEPNFEDYMKRLEADPNVSMNWLAQKLRSKSTPQEIKNEFVSVMTKAYQEFTILIYSQTKDKYGIQQTQLLPINANRYSITKTIIETWKEQQKIAPIVTRVSGNYQLNAEMVNDLSTRLREVQTLFAEQQSLKHTLPRFKEINEIVNPMAQQLVKDMFTLNGIVLSDLAYAKLFSKTQALTLKSNFPGDFRQQFSVKADGDPNGIFSAFISRLQNSMDQENEEGVMFQQNNPLYKETDTMELLANLYAQDAPILYSSTHRNSEGKSVWDYSLNTYLSHIIRDLTAENSPYRDALSKTDLSRNNWLLTALNTNASTRKFLTLDYLDGLKNRYGKQDSGVTRTAMSDREQLLLAVGLFQNGGRKSTAYLSLTHSDKSKTPVFRGLPRLGIVNRGALMVKTLDKLYDTFKGEFDRIVRGTNAQEGVYQHAQYEKGNKLFYQIPIFNYEDMLDLVGKEIVAKEDMAYFWIEKGRINDKDMGSPRFKELARNILNKFALDMGEAMHQRMTRLQLVTPDGNMFDRKYVKKLEGRTGVIATSGPEGMRYKDVTQQDQFITAAQYNEKIAQAAALDFAVSAFLFNTSLAQLITGDPAEYYKPVKGVTSDLAHVENTMIEYQKRMAGIIAPGKDGAVSREETYAAVTLADREVGIKFLENISAYAKGVNVTDAQELTTMKEHLYVMSYYGVIKDDIYQEMLQIIDKAGPGGYYDFDVATNPNREKHMDIILQIMKPVYFGARNLSQDGSAVLHDYIKSSSLPLYPPFTKNLEIDKLRIAMEKKNIPRANFISAKKVGASGTVQIFNDNGTIKDDIFDSPEFQKATQLLKRGGLRLQQDTPYDENKKQILTVSQMDTLITQGIDRISDFKLSDGTTHTGEEITKMKAGIRNQLIDINVEKFRDAVGASIVDGKLQIVDKNKFLNKLVKAAKERGYNDNDIAGITVRATDGTPIIPLFLSSASQTYESLMMSLVNDIVKVKVDGKSFIQASSAGIRTMATDVPGGITWVPGYEGKDLQMMRKEDGKAHAAQVIVPFNFFTKRGKVSIKDYMKDGKLDLDKIPIELLQMVGARIPCQGHNSMIALEIVGFLPENMGDTIIVPEGITTQMGSDFDVDKLFVYRRPHVYSEGKFTTVQDGLPETFERLGADAAEWEHLRDTAISNLKAKGVKPDGEEGRYLSDTMNKELGKVVAITYPDGNVPKHAVTFREGKPADESAKLKAQYFDIHWSILTHPEMYDEVTKPLDNNDMKDEAAIATQPSKLPFFDIGRQLDDFSSQKDAKAMVGFYALNTKFSAMVEGKDLKLGHWEERDGGGREEIDDPITIFKTEDGKVMDLVSLSKPGVGVITDAKGVKHTRSKHDNIRTQLSEVVDHAKNRTIDKLNLTIHTQPVAAAITLLSSNDNDAATLKHVSRFLQQEGARMYSERMAQAQDSLSTRTTGNVKDKVIGDITEFIEKQASINTATMSAAEVLTTLDNKSDAKTFSPDDMLKLIKTSETNKDKGYWQKQKVLWDAFVKFEMVGKRISEMQALLNQGVNGAGPNMLTVFDKLSKFSDVLNNPPILNGDQLYNDTEQGKAFDATIHTASQVYDDLLPYSKMFPLVESISKLQGNKSIVDMPINTKKNVVNAVKAFIFSGTQENIQSERARLLYKTPQGLSLAERVLNAQNTDWGKRNYFLMRLRPQMEITSPSYVSYIASKVTSMDDIENIRGWISMLSSEDKEIKFLGEDLLKYTYLTGGVQDANSFAKYIPFGYIVSTDIPGYLQRSFDNIGEVTPAFIRQWFQHNPSMARSLSDNFAETGNKLDKMPEMFNLPPMIAGQEATNPARDMIIRIGKDVNYMPFLAYRDKTSNRWILYERQTEGTEQEGPLYTRIDTLGSTGTDEYNRESGNVRSLIPVNRALISAPKATSEVKQKVPLPSKPINNSQPVFQVHPKWKAAGVTSQFTDADAVDSQVLEHIKNNEQAPLMYRVLAKHLQGLKLDDRTQYSMENASALLTSGAISYQRPIIQIVEKTGARFKFPTNVIEISNDASSLREGTGTEIILHELLHAYTIPYIHTAQEAKGTVKNAIFRLEELRREVLDHLGGNPVSHMVTYSLGNVEEFITHAISNKEFMTLLNGIKLKEGKKTVLTRIIELFTELFEAISDFLGHPIDKESVLHEAVLNIEQLLMHQAEGSFLASEITSTPAKQQADVKEQTEQTGDKKYELFPGVFANEKQKGAIDQIPNFVNSMRGTRGSLTSRSFVLSGAGGTGKTTVIRKVLEALDGYSVAMAAPSHNAVVELKHALGTNKYPVKTLQSELRMKKDARESRKLGKDVYKRDTTNMFVPKAIESADIIVIDESSMVDDQMILWLQEAIKPGAVVIFMGDYAQLQPVGQDHDSFPFAKVLGLEGQSIVLTENMRAKFADVSNIVTKYRMAFDKLKNDPSITNSLPIDTLANRVNSDNVTYIKRGTTMIDTYTKAFRSNPGNPKNALIVAFRNATREKYNSAIRQSLWGDNAKSKYAPGELLIMNNSFPLPETADKLIEKYELDAMFNMQRVIVVNASEKEITKRISSPGLGTIQITGMGHQLTLNLGPDFGNEQIVIDALPTSLTNNIISRMQAEGYDERRKGYTITDPEIQKIVGTSFLSYGKFVDIAEIISSMAFDADYGYAVTSHKSQGSAYNHTFVDEHDISSVSMNTMKNKLSSLYTAVSRTKDKLYIFNPMNPEGTSSIASAYMEAASNTLMNGSAGPWNINTDPEVLKQTAAEYFPDLEVSTNTTPTPGVTEISFGFAPRAKVSDKVSMFIAELQTQKEDIKASFNKNISKEEKASKQAKLAELDKAIEELDETGNLALIPKIGAQQLKWVQTTIDKDNPSPNDIMTSWRVIELWSGILSLLYGPDATGAVGTPPAALTEVVGLAKSMYDKLGAEKMRVALNAISQEKNLIGQKFESELTDMNVFEGYALSANRATSALSQEVTLLIQNTARDRDQEGQAVISRLGKLQDMMIKAAGSKKGLASLYDDYIQNNTAGNAWGIVGRYSQDWYDFVADSRNKRVAEIRKIRATTSTAPGAEAPNKRIRKAWEKYWAKIDKNAMFVDTTKFFNADGSLKTGYEKHYDELKRELGDEIAKEQLELAKERYQEWLGDKEDADNEIEAKLLAGEFNEEEALRRKNAFFEEHSPDLFFKNKSGESFTPNNKGEWYTTISPKAALPLYHDQKYKEIVKNPQKLAIYNELKDILESHRKMLPMWVQRDLGSNFLPVVQKHLVSDISNVKDWLATLEQKAIDALTATEFEMANQSTSRIPIRFVNKGKFMKDGVFDTGAVSHDLPRIIELFSLMAIHYKHFSRAKDGIDMGHAVIKYIDLQRRENNKPGETLGNTLAAIEYTRDHLMYKKPKPVEGATGKKLYSLNPRTQAKIGGEIKKLLTEKHEIESKYAADSSSMTFDEYQKEIAAIDEKLANYNGQEIHFSKVGDMLIKINQIKALAYNPFSGFANLAFGMVSMYTYANGRQDFTVKNAHQAMGLMRSSMKKWWTFGTHKGETSEKIVNIINRIGIENDIVDSEYGEGNLPGRKSKVKKIIKPFELLRSTDYYMKGTIITAMLLHSKIKVMKDGVETEMSMWEALGNDGKFKYPVAEEWQSEDETKETAWTKYRNKSIRVNQIIMGNMDKNSPKLLSKYVLGRLIGQFRLSWLPEGFAARFEGEKYDIQLGRTIKGRYKTYSDLGWAESVKVQLKQLANLVITTDPFTGVSKLNGKPLTDVDIENMRRNFTGLLWTLGTMMAIMSIKHLFMPDKDDKDNMVKETIMIAMNLMNRLNQDLTFYSSPDVANTVLRNFVPAMDVINDYIKAVGAFNKAVMNDDYGWDKAALKFTHATPYLNLINKFDYMSSRDLSNMSR